MVKITMVEPNKEQALLAICIGLKLKLTFLILDLVMPDIKSFC